MKRIICFLLALALMVTVPVANATAELEEAEYREEYEASSIWLSETEGTVHLSDPEGLLLEMELDMRIPADTVLETEAESLAVMDMDRWRLAIMDESSRAGFTQTEYGSRISISLQSGAMYFRVGVPLEDDESFEVVMDDIILAIRGTCGMVQRSEEEGLAVVLASGHATISRVTAADEEPVEIGIAAGEIVSVAESETGGGITLDKKELTEDEAPDFLIESLRRDPRMLEKVYEETGWEPEALFGEDIPVWMPPGKEMSEIPPEWIGRTFGRGGKHGIREYISFPTSREMIWGEGENPDYYEMTFPVRSVTQYTPHFYAISFEEEIYDRFIVSPGISDDEIRILTGGLRLVPLKDSWEDIQQSNRYTVIEGDDYASSWYAMYLEDITEVGVKDAQPLRDYQPDAFYEGFDEEIADDPDEPGGEIPDYPDATIAELPDLIIGKTMHHQRVRFNYQHNLMDPYRPYYQDHVTVRTDEEEWKFLATDTLQITQRQQLKDYILGDSEPWLSTEDHDDVYTYHIVRTYRVSEHIYLLCYENQEHEHPILYKGYLTIPGMSSDELALCREYMAEVNCTFDDGVEMHGDMPGEALAFCREYMDEMNYKPDEEKMADGNICCFISPYSAIATEIR